MQLAGFHHITAVTAEAAANLRFYTATLGLRLVKKTVNQDDVSAYHLFYADRRGTPGTDLTFFEWPVPRERRGTRSIVRTGLRVATGETLEWWAARFDQQQVSREPITERDGRRVFDFEDPEGQRLMLVEEGPVSGGFEPWESSPVPAKHQIRGLGPVTISVPVLAPTENLLTELLGMRRARKYSISGDKTPRVVFEMGEGGPRAELHVATEPHLAAARVGAGGVHHLALRAPGPEQYEEWIRRVAAHGVASSGPVDRYYFKSLYFREPGGILFEIATDGPGFAVDEPAESLGERLALPPFLEARRPEIEAGLQPL